MTRLEKVVLSSVLALLVGLLLSLYWTDHQADETWLKFAEEHNCRKVGEQESSLFFPRKVGYLCDDGVTYWREE